MIAIPGGTLLMGSDEFYRDEGPVHEREVDRSRSDQHPVTNEEFAAFVDETGYVTVAERDLDPADFPGADPADLVPGAMVFTPTAGPVDLRDWRQWWRWQPGAYWRAPEGPGSSIDERMRHPVVQVSFEDAAAYARGRASVCRPRRVGMGRTRRARRRALRVGRRGAPGRASCMANSWQGSFPYRQHGRRGVGGHLARRHVPRRTATGCST